MALDLNRKSFAIGCLALLLLAGASLEAQTNPLWTERPVKNYLPHMSWPQVEELLTRTDMVIFPLASLEQHGPHLPIGTDYLNAVEIAKLIAQRTDVLVAPVLLAGNAPYHMGFPGTVTLSSETIQQVYFEAAQSLLRHGFKRFLIFNGHGGNRIISQYIADRINHETAGIAVELGQASAPFRRRDTTPSRSTVLDRHAGTPETSNSLYLIPSLVDLEKARPANVSMPAHLEAMLPQVLGGDSTALTVFLAEGLKKEETGKNTSTREMSDTGVWGSRDPRESTLERGRGQVENTVDAAVQFIRRWNELRPLEGG